MTIELRPKVLARRAVGHSRPWLLYPTAESASSLQIERKYAYLKALDERRHVPGCVLEVGCWLGGTAAMASSFLARTGGERRYVCIDTFAGFVEEHFDRDVEHGTPETHRTRFRDGDIDTVRALLERWGARSVELVQGDICTTTELPAVVAVCLLDVDLAEPVYEGLRRVVPLLASGGVVLVDDCPESTSWAGARIGYQQWCSENQVSEEYLFGFGVARGEHAQ